VEFAVESGKDVVIGRRIMEVVDLGERDGPVKGDLQLRGLQRKAGVPRPPLRSVEPAAGRMSMTALG
jgi:hypothetical protein